MKPKLRVIVGASQGQTFVLDQTRPLKIGRETSNDLVIPDWIVSREHCLLKYTPVGVTLEDLNSHNGTLVNDVRVQLHSLCHGDVIRIASFKAVFLEADDEEDSFVDVVLDQSLQTKSDIHLPITAPHFESREDFGVLARVGEVLNSSKDAVALQRKLVEIAVDVMPAKRAALVRIENGAATAIATIDKSDSATRKMLLSQTVTQLVLRDQVALLSNALSESKLDAAQSLHESQICSVLCVPVSNRSFQSVLYLDSDDPAVQFTEADLHKITAIASVISAATGKFEELEKLLRQNEYFQSEFSLKTNIIGAGSAIRKVLRLVAKIAPSESTVLVTGESGTGKELIARAIHQNSPRADERYVAINCAVLNTPLLESELFGHEKGAFTGAIAQKKGKLELAHRGTLFLDEVAELSVEVQAKLLRFLEEREFGRVGGNNTISVDVRLVAATNKDLREAVKQGLFRQDLFFRLNVVPIQVPPLRERQEDIRKLAEHFLIKHATRCRRNIGGFAPDALRALEAYDWPGNVRELANAIERAVVLGSDDSIQLLDLPESINENPLVLPASSNHFSVRLRLARKKIVLDALAQAGGNYSEAAKLLGILPGNLHRMAKSLRIKEMNRF